MSGYGGGSAADQYLAQRIQGASPEQLAALLLEGAHRFLNQALAAMRKGDIPAKARLVNRVAAIIDELTIGLDMEQGGDLAVNLARIYEWWSHELFTASQTNQPERLEHIARQMLEIRSAWETAHQQNRTKDAASGQTSTDGMMV